MKMSEQVNDLFAALSKFQGDLENAPKSRSGHGYKYADLAECINAAKEPLTKNGLAVTQMIGESDKGHTLITMLTHSSGQYVSSEFLMAMAKMQGGAGSNPAQQMGGSITYMRRYAYTSILGMAQEDNDAVEARKSAKSPVNESLLNAIKVGDREWVSSNWSGIVKDNWNLLSCDQQNKLNELINQ